MLLIACSAITTASAQQKGKQDNVPYNVKALFRTIITTWGEPNEVYSAPPTSIATTIGGNPSGSSSVSITNPAEDAISITDTTRIENALAFIGRTSIRAGR